MTDIDPTRFRSEGSRTEVLDGGPASIDHARRHRGWLAIGALGVTAAAVAWTVITGHGGHDMVPPAPTQPSPSPAMFALPADPFMTDSEVDAAFPTGAFARDPNTRPRRLSPCLTDPRGWGAAQAMAATYRSRTSPTVSLNEYVLRFADAASAHRALLAGWEGLVSCQPSHRVDPLSDDGGRFDDYLADKSAHQDRHDRLYELFVVRVGMVVVIIEDTDFPREEGGAATHFVSVPLKRAIPGYFAGYTPDCVENPQPCPNPTSFG